MSIQKLEVITKFESYSHVGPEEGLKRILKHAKKDPLFRYARFFGRFEDIEIPPSVCRDCIHPDLPSLGHEDVKTVRVTRDEDGSEVGTFALCWKHRELYMDEDLGLTVTEL